MHIEAFLIFTGILLAIGSLIGMRSESAAARRERRIARRPVAVVPKVQSQSRRKIKMARAAAGR